MMNNEEPLNYILASGKEYSIYDFICVCLQKLHFDNTKWIEKDGTISLFYCDNEIIKSKSIIPIKNIIGNITDTKKILNWEPRISFEKMVEDMCNNVY